MIQTLNKRKTLTITKRTTASQRLAQQKSDFTAEGAPPPGRVAADVPVTEAAAEDAAHATPPADTRLPGHDSDVTRRS